MTTPARNTPYAIIGDAMKDCGKLERGNTPDSEMLADGMQRLQDLINITQTEGIKLFLMEDKSITLTSGTATYTVTVSSVKPLRVDQAYFLDSSSVRRPIYPLSWDEWIRLSTVTDTGAISQYFINKQSTILSVSFWLIPDATAALGTAHLLLRRQVTSPISLTETMEFPIEWRMFLRWGLADEMATGQPQTIMDRCQQRAMMYKEKLEGWDVEDTETRFEPDSRYGGQSSFR